MSVWKIYSINNATHEVTLTNEAKSQLKCVVPEEHCGSPEAHAAYLKTQTDAYDLKNKVISYKNYVVYGLLAFETAYILLKLLVK